MYLSSCLGPIQRERFQILPDLTTYWTCEAVQAADVPVGVLLRKEEDGVMGGVTGGVRFPLVWRGGVEMLLRDRLPVRAKDNLGCTFFFTASCSRRAASVMNLQAS